MKLPKLYVASQFEDDISALWEKSEIFVADPDSHKEHYSISMPPPNETGTLHIGHALFITIQDILARHARQQGKDVLWLPGTDHAAIATNAVMERRLAEQGTNKHLVGREEFLRQTIEFVGQSRETINHQIRAMGASVDWTRYRNTLDATLSRCVNEVFVKMYKDGLIYRGYRIVNWDPKLETTVSDDEVIYQEEQGKLYTFQFGPFQISTARPETKFSDKYVVMHPDDKRYTQYKHGDTFKAEWINGPITATIIKDSAADPSFGTGVMTITPWHSLVDFEIAERHDLDKEQVIDFHGRLLPVAGEFSGMTILEARTPIVEKLKSKGLIVNIDEDYIHNIATNSRGNGLIEPQIRLQWFIDVNKPIVEWKGSKLSLKEVLQSVIRDKDINIIPERFSKVYFHWIDNLRDWCISRQIWWGHRIPVWYRTNSDGQQETYAGVLAPTDQSEGWNEWVQDPDTLDTWFSSSLWTWSTLIDPSLASNYDLSLNELLKKSTDFQTYHPTTVIETGWDILFFWVARMILTTTYTIGQVPFSTIYLHGLVRTEEGHKMSKSSPETIINPLDVIPEYGTDSLRLALIQGMTAGNDQRLGKNKIIANRNFANKLWNIARYIEVSVGDITEKGSVQPQTAADHWILYKLSATQKIIDQDINNYRFSDAYDNLYHFIWNDVADWYIEVSKIAPNKALLAHLLEVVLLLAHPFAPFVTETIWQTLAWENNSILAAKEFAKPLTFDAKTAKEFSEIQNIITEVRFITNTLKVNRATLYYTAVPILAENALLIARISRLAAVTEVKAGNGLNLTSTIYDCWLDIDQATAQNYLTELLAKQSKQKQIIKQLETRLADSAYRDKAPSIIVTQTKDQLELARRLSDSLEKEYSRFSDNSHP